ncbi:hypothetical protein CWO17_20790 [Vibrio sp. 10N.286.45.A3]|uniref:hypothetical protein n=1 Tax=Vibrio TaxID=662 RepID=UPI000C8542AF|nr:MULTISPECIES: hypothetical protein [unclassified Vibrio]PMI24686.1 hypothetical protein BCU50_22100 [Vibrio sp. 10N.286.46.E10]PTO98646.1 hypothetical protein CWO17_20790 [Vibrio sp. 10N.286.45.A3]TKE75198.1 hypothetical protein FCV56_22555 [Vibrio sp. F12]TKE82308.1 hypothetical protein FCV54_12145 [Vibrio sp. F12]TKE88126.1 hypothetical protein FCV53_23380 [Vibrio sp. F12]
MKNRILALSLLGLSSSVFADSELPSSSYEMTVAVEEQSLKHDFPSVKFDYLGQTLTTSVDECSYTGTLSEDDDNTILLSATMSCTYESGSSYNEMPDFVLKHEGGEASMSFGDGETDMWTYSVTVKKLDL